MGGNLLAFKAECFSFPASMLVEQSNSRRKRSNEALFQNEMAEHSQDCYGQPPDDEGEAYPYTHLPRDMVSGVSTIRY
jgi:hypothetical protein